MYQPSRIEPSPSTLLEKIMKQPEPSFMALIKVLSELQLRMVWEDGTVLSKMLSGSLSSHQAYR